MSKYKATSIKYVFHFFIFLVVEMMQAQCNFIQTLGQAIQPVGQSVSQACSCCVLCVIHVTLSSSPVHPTSHLDSLFPLSVCPRPGQLQYSTIQPLSLSAPPPHVDLLSCPRMRSSDVPASALRLSLY